MQPFVSVVTPTFNRRKFIPWAIKIYESYTYPKNKMEWIVLDDGTDKVEDLFIEASKQIPNIRYIYSAQKMNIGQKRNILNKEAKGEIIISMDDDDYYPECRINHVVAKLGSKRAVELAGSSEMYMYFSDIKTIYTVGPYNPNHATNGTLACRKSYTLTHFYDETVKHAEEKSFLDEYKNPMIQLDPKKTIFVICHSANTFDKTKMRDNPQTLTKKTGMKIKQFIKDKELRDFYSIL